MGVDRIDDLTQEYFITSKGKRSISRMYYAQTDAMQHSNVQVTTVVTISIDSIVERKVKYSRDYCSK